MEENAKQAKQCSRICHFWHVCHLNTRDVIFMWVRRLKKNFIILLKHAGKKSSCICSDVHNLYIYDDSITFLLFDYDSKTRN